MENKYMKIVKKLEKHGFETYLFNNGKEVNEFLLDKTKGDYSTTFGGSMTLLDLGTYDLLEENNYNVNWHWKNGGLKNNKDLFDKRIYITSTNALTEDGKLVNMDGVGNRVASMITGYEKVYVVVGKNKIVKDVEAGIERIKNIAAPLNAKRLNKKTPCAITGKCTDCDSPDRICCAEVVLHRNTMDSNIIICIVDEELGY